MTMCFNGKKGINRMKKLAILMILNTIFLGHALADSGRDELIKISNLIAEEKYEEALSRQVEYFTNREGFSGVRLSFGIGTWMDLIRVYPPALEPLLAIKQSNLESLKTDGGSFDIFGEYKAINRVLDLEEETIETFLKIEEQFPDKAESIYFSASDLLMRHKRYDVVARHMKDLIFEYEEIRHRRERDISSLRERGQLARADKMQSINQRYVSDVSNLFGLLDFLDDQATRQEVYNRATEYFADESFEKK